MLRDVNITISDGGLGITSQKGEGIHLKIGASHINKDITVIKGYFDANQIKSSLGLSPLADACMDSVENGANLIYCIPVTPSIEGKTSIVDKNATGDGTVLVEGKPNNSYEIVVKFTGAGEFNTASYKYSIDGGNNYSEELTLPLDGAVEIVGTGIVFKFKQSLDNEVVSFEIDDTYKVTTTEPKMSNADVLNAVSKIKNINQHFEFVHIVGETDKTLWVAVSEEQRKLMKEFHKPLFFILESKNKSSEETVEEYVENLLKDKKDINNYDIQIVSSRSIYKRMDNSIKEINNAAIVCGLYSRAPIQKSIGETKSFSISESKMSKLMPEGIEEFIGLLDKNNYLTFRQYDGLEGYFITNARMMCPENSDYRYAELVRVKNKLTKVVRKEALLQLQSEIDMSDIQGSLSSIIKFIEIPIDKMIDLKQISSARVELLEEQDILTSETMKLKIRFVPKGYIREIDVDLGMENPYLNSN